MLGLPGAVAPKRVHGHVPGAGVDVRVGVSVMVGVGEAVGVSVKVGVAVRVGVLVGVAVGLSVGVSVGVGVALGVAAPAQLLVEHVTNDTLAHSLTNTGSGQGKLPPSVLVPEADRAQSREILTRWQQ